MTTDEEIKGDNRIKRAREYIQKYTKSYHSITQFDIAIGAAIQKTRQEYEKKKDY